MVGASRLSPPLCGLAALGDQHPRNARVVLLFRHAGGKPMALSRREFVRILCAGGAAVATSSGMIGYGREDLEAFQGQGGRGGQRPQQSGPPPIRLSSNENLRGPSPKVIAALKAHPSAELG